MKPLTKPMKGITFPLLNLLIHLNWAKSFTWAEDKNGDRSIYYIGIRKVIGKEVRLINIFFLPIKITIGWTRK